MLIQNSSLKQYENVICSTGIELYNKSGFEYNSREIGYISLLLSTPFSIYFSSSSFYLIKSLVSPNVKPKIVSFDCE